LEQKPQIFTPDLEQKMPIFTPDLEQNIIFAKKFKGYV